MLVPAAWDQQNGGDSWVLLLDKSVPGMQVTQKAGYTQVQVLGPPPVGVSVMMLWLMQVVDYSSGVSAFSCIWKEHLNWRWWPTFWRLNWLSTPNEANLDECITLCQTQAQVIVSGSCLCTLESPIVFPLLSHLSRSKLWQSPGKPQACGNIGIIPPSGFPHKKTNRLTPEGGPPWDISFQSQPVLEAPIVFAISQYIVL